MEIYGPAGNGVEGSTTTVTGFPAATTWAPSTSFTLNQFVRYNRTGSSDTNAGGLYQVTTAHTAGSTFDASKFLGLAIEVPGPAGPTGGSSSTIVLHQRNATGAVASGAIPSGTAATGTTLADGSSDGGGSRAILYAGDPATALRTDDGDTTYARLNSGSGTALLRVSFDPITISSGNIVSATDATLRLRVEALPTTNPSLRARWRNPENPTAAAWSSAVATGSTTYTTMTLAPPLSGGWDEAAFRAGTLELEIEYGTTGNQNVRVTMASVTATHQPAVPQATLVGGTEALATMDYDTSYARFAAATSDLAATPGRLTFELAPIVPPDPAVLTRATVTVVSRSEGGNASGGSGANQPFTMELNAGGSAIANTFSTFTDNIWHEETWELPLEQVTKFVLASGFTGEALQQQNQIGQDFALRFSHVYLTAYFQQNPGT